MLLRKLAEQVNIVIPETPTRQGKYMYVCMYACMKYICNVCMCVCTYEMNIYVCINVYMYSVSMYMYVRMYECAYVSIYVCLYVCMYVTYIHTYIVGWHPCPGTMYLNQAMGSSESETVPEVEPNNVPQNETASIANVCMYVCMYCMNVL